MTKNRDFTVELTVTFRAKVGAKHSGYREFCGYAKRILAALAERETVLERMISCEIDHDTAQELRPAEWKPVDKARETIEGLQGLPGSEQERPEQECPF